MLLYTIRLIKKPLAVRQTRLAPSQLLEMQPTERRFTSMLTITVKPMKPKLQRCSSSRPVLLQTSFQIFHSPNMHWMEPLQVSNLTNGSLTMPTVKLIMVKSLSMLSAIPQLIEPSLTTSMSLLIVQPMVPNVRLLFLIQNKSQSSKIYTFGSTSMESLRHLMERQAEASWSTDATSTWLTQQMPSRAFSYNQMIQP